LKATSGSTMTTFDGAGVISPDPVAVVPRGARRLDERQLAVISWSVTIATTDEGDDREHRRDEPVDRADAVGSRGPGGSNPRWCRHRGHSGNDRRWPRGRRVDGVPSDGVPRDRPKRRRGSRAGADSYPPKVRLTRRAATFDDVALATVLASVGPAEGDSVEDVEAGDGG
jgi:hypothetical protein